MTPPITPELFGTDFWDNADTILSDLGAESPVHQAVLPGGLRVWLLIAGHQETRSALMDQQQFGKDANTLREIVHTQLAALGMPSGVSELVAPSMMFSDGTAHRRTRQLVSAAFTAKRIDDLRPQVEQITEALVAVLACGEPVDIVARFAFELPITVTCELLGIPLADRALVRRWTTDLMSDDPAINVPGSRAMADYLLDVIAAKRAEPSTDLISALCAATDGDQLDDDELLATAILLVVAAHEPTTNLISNAIKMLIDQPDVWRALRADPAMAGSVVDEVLRWDSPVRTGSWRYTRNPVTVGPMTIPAGEIVLMVLSTANHDPNVFPEPNRFDATRANAREYLAFGYGPHYCLGARLGRIEAITALTALTQRFAAASLAVPATVLRRRASVIMSGWASLPIILRPVC